ncbi:MAG TPA: UbiA family prenyltransferase, partial [bacterium]|nr:UbiA family prenyltransferase [bacterium]
MAEHPVEPVLPPRTAGMWVQAVRPFSFTASLVPVLLGSAVAATQGMFHPGLFLLTLLGAVAIQGAANLFSDYFDYRSGY